MRGDARQAGKSTLASVLADASPGSDWRSLDQPQWLSAAQQDPTGFVQRTRLLGSYVRDLIDRDIRQLADIGRTDEMRRLLQLVAARTGQLVVGAELANDLSVSGRTVNRYLELCEETFLIKRVPAWSSNLAKRAITSPKVAFVDSGIAAYLLGQSTARLSQLTSQAIGPLMEGFVVMELARQLSWACEEIRLYHYRTKDKVEVDAILETNDGRIAAVEVKGVQHGDRFRLRWATTCRAAGG